MGRDRQGNGEALVDDRRKAGRDAHHPEPVAARLSGLAGWPLAGWRVCRPAPLRLPLFLCHVYSYVQYVSMGPHA